MTLANCWSSLMKLAKKKVGGDHMGDRMWRAGYVEGAFDALESVKQICDHSTDFKILYGYIESFKSKKDNDER